MNTAVADLQLVSSKKFLHTGHKMRRDEDWTFFFFFIHKNCLKAKEHIGPYGLYYIYT